MGQHAHQIGLRREFGLVEFTLDRLHRNDAQRRPPRQPHFGHGQHGGGRHPADHQLGAGAFAGAQCSNCGGKAVGDVGDIGRWAKQPARRLVDEVDAALIVDADQRAWHVIDQCGEIAVFVLGVGAFLAQPGDGGIKAGAQRIKAAAQPFAAEALREIAMGKRHDKARHGKVGAAQEQP